MRLSAAAASWWKSSAEMWFLRDAGILGILALPVFVLALLLNNAPYDLHSQVQQLLTLLAMAGVAAAAILVSFSGRIDRDVATMRLGSALIVYGALVLPLGVVDIDRTLGSVGTLVEVLCAAAVVILLVLGLSGWGVPTMAWPAAAVAIASCLCAAASLAVVPWWLPAPASLAAPFAGVLACWAAVLVALILVGIRRTSVLLRRAGLGMALLVLSQVAPLSAGPVSTQFAFAVSALRALAVAVVLAGVIPHLMAALRQQRARDIDAAVRLQLAEEAGQAAERVAADHRHEMRNLVTGLSGAAYLLTEDVAGTGPSTADSDRAELARALRTELARLSRMLEREPRIDTVPAGTGFALAPVVLTVAAVRRAAGTRIDLDVAPELRAHGSPEAFAQVITNLLVNCARHAPGARVAVHGHQDGDRVLLRVADDGPGVPSGTERLVLRRGRRSPLSGGGGLGLDISSALMNEHGGALRVLPSRPGAGFVVELELPAAWRGAVPATRGSTWSPGEVVLGEHVTLRAAAS